MPENEQINGYLTSTNNDTRKQLVFKIRGLSAI